MYFYLFYNIIYSGDGKADFSASLHLVFSVTWFFRNHSNMLLKKYLFLSMLKIAVQPYTFVVILIIFVLGEWI